MLWCKLTTSSFFVGYYGPCSFGVRHFISACSAWHLGGSWRNKVANVFRQLADRIERRDTMIIDFQGPLPADWDMALKALEFGLTEGTKRFNELYYAKGD